MTTNPDINETDKAPDWANHPDPQAVQKIVLGELGGDQKALGSLPKNFADEFKNVTHLYLWGLKGLASLPKLPSGLKCLHVRKCPDLLEMEEKTNLPSGLEELVIEDADSLQDLLFDQGRQMDCLVDLRLAACPLIPASTVNDLIAVSPVLRLLDCSGLPQLERITVDRWPSKLVDLRLNQCGGLVDLEPDEWPTGLRRLELQGTSLKKLSEFHLNLDYINLRDTKQLEKLPKGLPALLTERAKQAESKRRLRTLLIHGSALELPEVMFDSEDFNSADWVFAHLEGEDQREPLNEVKVILVGDGRCGKSSLARRFVKGEALKKDEPSTHGIQLWRLEDLKFVPEGEVGKTSNAQLNFWDFAGQDLYHNTHRLFFQSQAIFLICGTCSGKGWDKESDKVEKAAAEMDGGGDHNLSYWRQMIDSIESASGKRPPIAFVRTKVDRGGDVEGYLEINKEALEGIEQIDFSADTGQGVDSLTKWLQKGVTQVLGPLGRREIHKNALQVRRSLQEKMLKNEEAHEAAEGTEKMAKPPHPTMALEEFQQLTRELCSGAYSKHPESLLSLLHRSGFLFYDGEHMKDSVVLDQRWAINGIYTALNRKTAWPHLEAAGGRCTLELLREWGWAEACFSEKEEELFLHFMLSCGLVFRLRENRLGEVEYVAVKALSKLSSDDRRRILKQRKGVAAKGSPVELRHKSLSGDAVLALIASLGNHWGRSAALWKWGGQFQSYRGHWEKGHMPTFVHLDWEPDIKQSFGGKLTLTQYGPDDSFLLAILNECKAQDGFSRIDFPEYDELRGPSIPTDESQRTGADSEKVEGHVALPLTVKGVVVGISYAGDPGDKQDDVDRLPTGSLERWPRKLTRLLKDKGYFVDEYRNEQAKPEHEQESDRAKYMHRVVGADFVFCFLSDKYLESPWCMWEFLKVLKRTKGWPTLTGFESALVRSLGRPPFSQGKAIDDESGGSVRVGQVQGFRGYWKIGLRWLKLKSGSEANPVQRFRDFWKASLRSFKQKIESELGDGQQTDVRRNTLKEQFAYHEWMDCVEDDTSRDAVVGALRASDNWTIKGLEGLDPDDDTSLRRLLEHLETQEVAKDWLIDCAKQAINGDRERATALYIRACSQDSSQGNDEDPHPVLHKKVDDSDIDALRELALGKYSTLKHGGHQVPDWRTFLDLIYE